MNLLKIAPRLNDYHWRILTQAWIGNSYYGSDNDHHLNKERFFYLVLKGKKETFRKVMANCYHWTKSENIRALRELIEMLEEDNDQR